MKTKTRHNLFSLLNFFVMILFLLPVISLRVSFNMNIYWWIIIVLCFSWVMSNYVPARIYQPFKVPELDKGDKVKSIKFNLFLPFVLAALTSFSNLEIWIYIPIVVAIFYLYGRELKELKIMEENKNGS